MECVSSLHSRRRPFSRVRRLLRPRFAPAVGHQRERHGGQAVQHVRFAPRFTRLLARARSGHMSEPLDVAPVRGRHRSVGRERVERPRLFLRVRLDRGGHLDAVRDRDIPPLLLHGRGRGSELALRFRFRRRGLLLGRMRRLLLLLFGAGLGVPLGVGRRLALPVALGTLTASSHARRLRLGRRLLRRLFRRVHVRAGRHLARDGAVVSRGRLQGPRAVRARAVLLVHILHLGPPARRRRRRRVVLRPVLLAPRMRPLGQEHHPRAVDDVGLDVSNVHQLAHILHPDHVVVRGPSDLDHLPTAGTARA
mmetsp:Transcript_8261/g.37391  ORF Transcript_8261/g.37391 Transcript_8261/m.37391 type:complete len:308 (+) Transcript_8261:1604-2527(+)